MGGDMYNQVTLPTRCKGKNPMLGSGAVPQRGKGGGGKSRGGSRGDRCGVPPDRPSGPSGAERNPSETELRSIG